MKMDLKKSPVIKASAIVSALSGVIILFSALYPIISYENYSKEHYPKLLNPLVNGSSIPSYYSLDYTKASNWFVVGDERVKAKSIGDGVNTYNLSIPKLGIEDAKVKIGGEDLSNNLIQFTGTKDPGQIGNSVIFGHSILPQFFNPEDYLSIFSTLPTLSEGDEIDINYDGIAYKYKIIKMFEVAPTDVDVLDQPTDDSYISLVTCVPPGHPLKPRRLIVRARIVPPDL